MYDIKDFPAADCVKDPAFNLLQWCIDYINQEVLHNNVPNPHFFVERVYRVYLATIDLEETLGDVRIHHEMGMNGSMRIPRTTRRKFIKQLDPTVQRLYYY